ncbi:MAG TPA: hypothetical protein VJK54_06535 [Chthoniobacterales bacterium]|nr:hypothetical protein [Chthoniobacterales bacterium]
MALKYRNTGTEPFYKNPITARIDAIQESLEIIEEALPAAQTLIEQVVSKEVTIRFH